MAADSPRMCPRCPDEVALTPTDYTEERVDICSQCHGVYFDQGELGELIELVEDFMVVKLDEPEIENLPTSEAEFKPACPGCHQTMEPHQISQTWIDRCPECHGVWLDQGELSALRATQMLIRGNLNLFIRLGQ